MKDETIIFRATKELKADLAELCERTTPRTTLSALMEHLGEEYVKKNRHLIKKSKTKSTSIKK